MFMVAETLAHWFWLGL